MKTYVVFKIECETSEDAGVLMVEYKNELIEALKDLIQEFDSSEDLEIRITTVEVTEEEIIESQALDV